MINPQVFINELKLRGVGLFAGVPDSLLKDFCAYLNDSASSEEHIITANEGNAIALVSGYHLATNKIGLVYLQNSGLGNTINPLTSLTDPEVYKIPLLMVIGWRGEPGVKDEPQHIKQGRITEEQLNLLEIPYFVLDSSSDLQVVLDSAFNKIKSINAPVALLVRSGSFSKYKQQKIVNEQGKILREQALRSIMGLISKNDLLISTTGKTSREVFELRVKNGEPQRDFLTVGAMGHTASIALGVAIGNPGKKTICLDGDGSLLMHFGSLPIIGSIKPKNFIHILLNNSAHESVGGQPTVAGKIDFSAISKACGYSSYFFADDEDSINKAWAELSSHEGPSLLEVRIKIGSREDIGRPTSTPEQNKKSFMEFASA